MAYKVSGNASARGVAKNTKKCLHKLQMFQLEQTIPPYPGALRVCSLNIRGKGKRRETAEKLQKEPEFVVNFKLELNSDTHTDTLLHRQVSVSVVS